ncbi:Na-translocating system protein MpsC family protein, partial [Pseudomonas sp. 2995-1]|uniref:Na-translocating system protein MpsC family protein n=1 Tax=Pseudomonas sp. 2995-1 TaxID=1712679 RepID=UPI002114A9D8
MKKHFGKGSEACQCIISGETNMMLVKVKNFMTPAEEVMVNKGEIQLASSYRAVIVNSIFESASMELADISGKKHDKVLHDWSYETNRGVIVILGEEEIESHFKEGHTPIP